MASQRLLSDDNITRLLLGEEDVGELEELPDSETEDNLEVEDVESDTQDDPSDHEGTQDRSSPAMQDNEQEPQTPPAPLAESSGSNSSILTFSQSNIRSRSRHVWASSKGRTSGRAAAINIVRVARGPTRTVRNILDALILFEQCMTNQILEEILKWTNSEIVIKRQNYDQSTSTQKETSKEEQSLMRAKVKVKLMVKVKVSHHPATFNQSRLQM